ncbi:hypothetical protein K488DRAFT_82502 [Vararia minispora EC-137]|uniref:Uncharacterized protein n=1 Tax=Vararia minispora EC-137 TaxID=1314806 RepID=A0ACB8QWR9_9AGAM|nr:hypothetical protein K488DRAFT_82502 [Vararia minispora EC-137]
MLTVGLRLTYDGLRSLVISVADVEKLIDEVYKDIAALHLVPPRKRAVVKPQGMESALDMFWDTPEQSVVYKQLRRCIENLDMDSPEIVQRSITSAQLYELPPDTLTILPNSRCIASAARSSRATTSPSLNGIIVKTAQSPSTPSTPENNATLSSGLSVQPPTAPRSMSLRASGKIPPVKQEDASSLNGNGGSVHRTLASRIQTDPYPPTAIHRPSNASRNKSSSESHSSSSKERSPHASYETRSAPLHESSVSATRSSTFSILGASAAEKRDETVERWPARLTPDPGNSGDARDMHRGRVVPEWRMLDERDGRRRAEAEVEDLRRQVLRLRECEGNREGRERSAGQTDDCSTLTATRQQLVEAGANIEAQQQFCLRAEEARTMLLGHGGCALQGAGTDIVDIVKSIERQFVALGNELAKERALRQAAEDTLHNMTMRNMSTAGGVGLPNGPGGVGVANALGGGTLGVTADGNGLSGNIHGLGSVAAGNVSGNLAGKLASLLQGKEAQLVPGLIQTIIELSAQKAGSSNGMVS